MLVEIRHYVVGGQKHIPSMRAACSSSSHMASFPPGMQRIERLPLVFPVVFWGVAAGNERGILQYPSWSLFFGRRCPRLSGEGPESFELETRSR